VTTFERDVTSRLGTEFGLVLAPLVVRTPGAIASILSDDVGDAIDFAHDPAELPALDVQLVGAQIGQSLLRLHRAARRHRLTDPLVLLETRGQGLVASGVAETYVLALLLGPRANLARAMITFSIARRRIHDLLE